MRYASAADVALYLHAHPLNPKARQLRLRAELLACDAARLSWLVRWPNGSIKWEGRDKLEAQGFSLAGEPLVGYVEIGGTESPLEVIFELYKGKQAELQRLPGPEAERR